MLANFYQKNIIEKPKLVISILLLILITAFYFSKEFRLDAISETLLLEDDQDLKYLNERFFIVSSEFILPKGE